MERRWDRHPAVLAAVFGAYVTLGKLSLHLALNSAGVSAFWPPAGIALSAFLLLGRGVWPAILAAAFVTNLHLTSLAFDTLWSSALIALGQTGGAILGAFLLDRFAGGRHAFRTSDSVFRAAALLGFFSTALSATWSVATLLLARLAVTADFPYLWTTSWMGQLTGDLVFAPFILLWAAGPWSLRHVRAMHVVEALGLLACLVVVGMFVFGGIYPSDIKTYPLEFLCGPFFLWAAFRFGRREVATAVVILSTIAVWGTAHRFGPFVQSTANESLILLQAYLSVTAIMSVAVAAVVDDHKAAEARLLDLATMDPLTGLSNYRRLMEVLRAEIARSDRTGREFSVLFFDVNGLKAINDRYGHLAGSRALCQVAQALRECSRATDTPARFGGDEFALVLAETGRWGAERVIRRVYERLASVDTTPAVSVSAGVAIYPEDGATPAVLIGRADQALYTAKGARPRVGARAKRPRRPQVEPLPDLFSDISRE